MFLSLLKWNIHFHFLDLQVLQMSHSPLIPNSMNSMFPSKWTTISFIPKKSIVDYFPKATVSPFLPFTFQYKVQKYTYSLSQSFLQRRASMQLTSRSRHMRRIKWERLLRKLVFTDIKVYMRPKQCSSLPSTSTMNMVRYLKLKWKGKPWRKTQELSEVSVDISSFILRTLT